MCKNVIIGRNGLLGLPIQDNLELSTGASFKNIEVIARQLDRAGQVYVKAVALSSGVSKGRWHRSAIKSALQECGVNVT